MRSRMMAMTKLRKISLVTGYVLGGPLILLLCYYGLYLCLLERKLYELNGRDPVTGQNRMEIIPSYRLDGDPVALVLAPAHQFDRQIRGDYWTTIEHSDGQRWKNPPAPRAAP